jgi:glucose-1-phosphate adenylyltransferase
VLGGGAGTRLYPLTKYRSKPAVPLAGKYRLIDIPISNSINSGIDRIMVLTQFNSASLNRHVARAFRFDHFSKGFVSILAAEQTFSSKEWFQGTADAVRQCMVHLDTHRHKHVLILSGDQLYRMDYRKMYRHHLSKKADITIATVPVAAHHASGLGILKTDEEARILDFVEKPPEDQLEGLESDVPAEMKEAGRVYLASMGIYIFNQKVLRTALADSDRHDFGKEIIPQSIEASRVYSYPFTGYWSDIGTIGSFFEANINLASKSPEFDMYDPQMPTYTNPRILPPAKIQSSYVQDSLIAEACVVVNSHIANSVIGIRSFIGSNTTIKRSVIMGADYYSWHDRSLRDREVDGPNNPGVGDDSYVENAILDRNVAVGKGCVIKNQEGVEEADGEFYYIRDGIVIIPKNTFVPDGTII